MDARTAIRVGVGTTALTALVGSLITWGASLDRRQSNIELYMERGLERIQSLENTQTGVQRRIDVMEAERLRDIDRLDRLERYTVTRERFLLPGPGVVTPQFP